MEPAFSLSSGGPVPYFMLQGRRLLADVPQGTPVMLDQIERPVNSALWELREQQDAQLL